jgi:S1-C subfamily serine protease
VQPVDAVLAEALGSTRPEGVLVAALHPESPFAAAGLAPGDHLLSLDGFPVNDPDELDFRLATRPPGAAALARVRRAGAEREVEVALGPAPDLPPADPRRIVGRTPLSGLTVARANPRLIEALNLPLSAEGVVVVAVEGSAARLGLRRGDVIVALDGRPVDSPATLERLADRPGRTLDLVLERGGRTLRLRLGP